VEARMSLPSRAPKGTPKIDRVMLWRVAAMVPCDPRTVETYMKGQRRTSHAASAGIKRALLALGVADPQQA